MPSVSGQQQRFMGMVHAIQQGTMPLSKASPRVRQVALSMHPKDATEFAATKTKDLPEKKDQKKEQEKQASFLPAVFLMVKAADVNSILNRTRQSVRQVAMARHKHLDAENKRLRQELARSTGQLHKHQSDLAAMPAALPQPPPAQAPYGAMLQQPEQDPKKR